MRKKHELLGYTSMWLAAVLVLIALLAQSVGDARIVNYSGIVRGATQKLVKEELNGQPDDALIQRLDGIIENLQTGRGEYQLNKSYSGEFQSQLTQLNEVWGHIKGEIVRVRAGGSGETLYQLSQTHFELADVMVLSAEEYSNKKLLGSILLYLVILLFSVGIYLAVGRRGRAAVEKSLYTDHLTGILNRAGFKAQAAGLLRRRPGGEYCLVEFDLDDFKFLNSTYGYELGDQLLCALAEALQAACRTDRLCARIDADDFVVLAPREGRELQKLRALLNGVMHQPRFLGLAEFVTFTMGGYEVADTGEEPQTMMDKVNLAHKSAKSAGKGSTAWYNAELLERFKRQSHLQNRMRRALENGEFKLYLQPKYRLDTMEMFGAEALVRWDYPGYGLIYPDHFIPLFEASGSITQLDFYMLEQACAWLRRHFDGGGGDFVVAVNCSRVTVYAQNFYTSVLDIVDKYRLPHRCIELELTESAFNDIAEPVAEKLLALQKKGFTISMDDFGAGYSNLNLLDKLPIQVLKLDKAFLQESRHESDRVRHVIACVVELSHALGISVVCEGVETKEQMEFLRQVGCDRGQGYYFARPIPCETLKAPEKSA